MNCKCGHYKYAHDFGKVRCKMPKCPCLKFKRGQMLVDDLWLDYIEALKRLEQAVKLTAFWTQETARATMETAYYTEETARSVRDYTTQSSKALDLPAQRL